MNKIECWYLKVTLVNGSQRIILEPLFVTYIHIFFGHCHVTFPYKEILSFVCHCHVTFPFMEPLSFSGRFVQLIIKKFVFQIHSLNSRRDIWMAAIMLQSILSFYTKISEKNLFISATTKEKYIVCTNYCIAHHNDKTCFLPACKHHVVLLRNVQELLKKWDTFCFTYQHVDCLYTLSKYRFNGQIIAKSGQVFDNVLRAVDFKHRNKGVDRMPSIAKKRLLKKKYKMQIFSSYQKTKKRRPVVQCLQKELKKLKRLNLNSNQ